MGITFPASARADIDPRLPHEFRVLVNLELLGGCDVHGIWLPTDPSRFYALAGRRPNAMFVSEPDLMISPGWDVGIGLHPRLAPLLRHLGTTRFILNASNAVRQGQTQSHEDAQNIMTLGVTERIAGSYAGWKGRLFMNESESSLLAFRGSRPADSTCDSRHARCANHPPLTVDTFESFKFSGKSFSSGLGGDPNSRYVAEIIGRLAAVEPQAQQSEVERKYRSALRGTYAAIDDIQQTAAYVTPQHDQYPATLFAHQLRNVAMLAKRMIAERSTDRVVVSIGLGGFDVHDNWHSRIDQLMNDFASGTAVFLDDLKAMNADKNVVLMTTTEFGRKIHDNGGGTDHGTSSTTIVSGGLIHGGSSLVYGEIPTPTEYATLPELHSHTDNRSVISYILERFMGFPRQSAFPPPLDTQFINEDLNLF